MRFLLAIFATLAAATASAASSVDIRLYPPRPLIEVTRLGQALNFDLEVRNMTKAVLELTAIRALVRDASGAVVQRLEVNDNGIAPGIETIPVRTWQPGESHTICNPFDTLGPDVPVSGIEYELLFKTPDGRAVTQKVVAEPRRYHAGTDLIMPLAGRVLVWDGHDFLSHHRRWDFSNPASRALGITTNASRYAFDFVVADRDGAFFTGDGQKREDYPGYGSPVLAPAAGTVVRMFGAAPNAAASMTAAGYRQDALRAVFGNYIVIDHGNGEYSQLGHLKQGSVKVRVGDKVTAGQVIAQVGASGTSLFPHLHYQLVDKPGLDGEGLPAAFTGVTRAGAMRQQRITRTWIDSGDIVESPPPAAK